MWICFLYNLFEIYSSENSLVTFYANAYFGNMLNITNSQVQLRVEPMKLKAAIKGMLFSGYYKFENG